MTGAPGPLPSHLLYAQRDLTNYSAHTIGQELTKKETSEVDVGVVHFTPLAQPQIKQPFKMVEKIVRNVFQFRGKYCYKGLEMLFPETYRAEMTRELMQKADVNPTLLPAQLTIPHIRALVDTYADMCAHEPDLFKYEFREDRRLKKQARQRSKAKDRFITDTVPENPLNNPAERRDEHRHRDEPTNGSC